MNGTARQKLRFAAVAAALLLPAASHIAGAMGQGYGVRLACAGGQAVAAGLVLWTALPGRRWAGPLTTAALLAALAAGAWHSAQAGLLAVAGLSHALLYAALLGVFAASLRPGRLALVTWLASRLNPGFHPGMVPYTRAVHWMWTLCFAGQLTASAVLLGTAPAFWPSFVTLWHGVACLVLAVTESLVRRWRWRHEHPTGLLETIRGTRRLMHQASNASTSR